MKKTSLTCILLCATLPIGFAQGIPPPTVTPTPTATATATPSNTFGVPFNRATPPNVPTPTPTVPPLPVSLASPFQPPSSPTPSPLYPTNLKWRIFTPSGSGPWPGVILLHIGLFYANSYYGPEIEAAAVDLSAAGYYTAIANYVLAPPNYVDGQPDHSDPASGRPPQQTDTVKAFIAAMIADFTHCNGHVAVIGGSAGGGHAAFVAIDQDFTNSSDWPFWGTGNRPEFVASLSGVHDGSDRSADAVLDETFVHAIENYTNTTSHLVQWQESPVGLVSSNPATIVPIYVIRADDDSMPASQQYYLFNAFANKGVATNLYQMWTIPNNPSHAFGYWSDPIVDTYPPSSTWKVSDRIIDYLDQFLKQGHTHF